jgi:hypothetical protein
MSIDNILQDYNPCVLCTEEEIKAEPPLTRAEKIVYILALDTPESIKGFTKSKDTYYEDLGFGIREIREIDRNGSELSKQNIYFIDQNLSLPKLKSVRRMLGIPVAKLEGEPVPESKAYQYLTEKLNSN